LPGGELPLKKLIKKFTFLFCIAAGITLLLYPTVKDRYGLYQQQKLLAQWEDNLRQLDAVPVEEMTAVETVLLADSAEEASADVPSALPVDVTATPLNVEPKAPKEPVRKDAEGLLIIDKINLKLPILTNATTKNLELSAASIAGTGKAGAVGNYAVAGHRNLTYGKNFNRLDEIIEGDVIEVDTGSKKYKYEVQKKIYVLPEDVWVLKGNDTDREITLVTCHPMKNPTHRLIVKGKIAD